MAERLRVGGAGIGAFFTSTGIGTHSAVAMVAVGPIHHEAKGELACACVVRRNGTHVTENELIDFTRDLLAAYKRPPGVVFVASQPTTSTGKIMRRKLAGAGPEEP